MINLYSFYTALNFLIFTLIFEHCKNVLKPFLYFFTALFLSYSSVAQRTYNAFDILDSNTIVPPNGIWLNGEFLDDSEVMNTHYLEYLHFLSQDSSSNTLVRAYPDTNIFGVRHLKQLLKSTKNYYKNKNGKHIPLQTLTHDQNIHEPSHKHHWWNYFSYHGTKHFPVIGISYEQALAYCAWRSKMVTTHFNDVLKKEKKYKAFADKKVLFEFSLPDELLWEKAAEDGLKIEEYPFGQKIGIDTLSHFNVTTKSGNPKKEPVECFNNSPNKNGFYNLIGNVAEMVKEKGKSKGGSFAHYLPDCQIRNAIPYTKPEKWLGFRCACKVKVEPLNKQ